MFLCFICFLSKRGSPHNCTSPNLQTGYRFFFYNYLSNYNRMTVEISKNPFVVGQSVPIEFDEMYATYGNYAECPEYLDNLDHLTYGVRGHTIPDEETATRLFNQYTRFCVDRKEIRFARTSKKCEAILAANFFDVPVQIYEYIMGRLEKYEPIKASAINNCLLNDVKQAKILFKISFWAYRIFVDGTFVYLIGDVTRTKFEVASCGQIGGRFTYTLKGHIPFIMQDQLNFFY